jgi:DNA-binding transcriptional LysR family regulator
MSPRDVDWERRIGRQLKLRDLHVLMTVAQHGSMAKAASHLSVTQPAISQAIADLERAVGVQLVDRGPRGVQLTTYGEKLLGRAAEAFDALKQGMRDIEFLTEPGLGEVCIGADMSVHRRWFRGCYHPAGIRPTPTSLDAGHRDDDQHGRSGVP